MRYVLAPSALNTFRALHGQDAPRPVFQSDGYSIFELPGAKPYAETGGDACRLTIAGRDAMRATCTKPATLLRRELFFPGWRATVNGQDVPVGQGQDIFQTVPLPAGQSDIAWTYSPRFSRWVWAAFLAGALSCALDVARESGVSDRRQPVTRALSPLA